MSCAKSTEYKCSATAKKREMWKVQRRWPEKKWKLNGHARLAFSSWTGRVLLLLPLPPAGFVVFFPLCPGSLLPRTRKMAIILYANLVAALTNLRPRLQGNRTGTGREQGRADERGADGGLLVGWWVGWAGARLAGWLPKSRSDSGKGNNNSAPRILI